MTYSLKDHIEQLQRGAKSIIAAFKANAKPPPGGWTPFLFLLHEKGRHAAPLSGTLMYNAEWRADFAHRLTAELLTKPEYLSITAVAVMAECTMMDMRRWHAEDVEAMVHFEHPPDLHPEAQHMLALTVITATRGIEVYAAPVMMGPDGYYQLGEFELMSDPCYTEVKTIWQPVIDLFRSRN